MGLFGIFGKKNKPVYGNGSISDYSETTAFIKKYYPKGYEEIKKQDAQIALIEKAEKYYHENKDTEGLIKFWEYIWANGGLLFDGIMMHFRLPDLYIKQKRYTDALLFCNMIKKTKGAYYSNKADAYIKKIEERINKSKSK